MASATGIPQVHPATIEQREDAPLLGSPGGATQKQDESIGRNLLSGTASVAQAGVWILAALVWSNIIAQPLSLFTPHPFLATSALLLQVQATLILQPTTTPAQKRLGTRIHYSFQLFSILSFLGAFAIIEINKGDHPHFVSPHGILGLTTVTLVVLQALVGVVQYFLPVPILGSVDAGKRLYKYHRWSGYVLLLLEVSTIVAATQTGYNLEVLQIPSWAVVIAILLILAGVGARIQKHKLGI
ncbi:hypothetical protein N7492_008433 [Penicillium capsulatum]|uniref:Cytochrome b561 domain-containing protein n=1 Tax=Penicillium capsulatum TaxID=69766 RepID=A0A9W9HSP2_9EURO|nr:hypothetical protein N7492_008433 [Penicillium capsulatum]KAJ6105835.1 hypothetical protein N7512_009352 [Penicillium capsulatum]